MYHVSMETSLFYPWQPALYLSMTTNLHAPCHVNFIQYIFVTTSLWVKSIPLKHLISRGPFAASIAIIKALVVQPTYPKHYGTGYWKVFKFFLLLGSDSIC